MMKAQILHTTRCSKTKTKSWRAASSYESCYRVVTSRNWSFVKAEAVYHIVASNQLHENATLYPVKVIFDHIHRGKLTFVTLDECLVDGRVQIIEVGEKNHI